MNDYRMVVTSLCLCLSKFYLSRPLLLTRKSANFPTMKNYHFLKIFYFFVCQIILKVSFDCCPVQYPAK